VFEHIEYQVDDPVATITLNRPESLNAWTDTMGTEVREAITRANDDPAVVGIVVTGAGRAFCAGADMNVLEAATRGDFSEAPTGASASGDGTPPVGMSGEDFDGAFTYLFATAKPVIAAINGPVAGMAFPFVLCCDLRFMAPDAILLTAFAQRGLIAEWGLSWLLSRLVGPGVTLDLLFSSRRVDGEEAFRLGLVNAVVAADDLLDHATGYVRELAERSSPTSMAIMKRQVYEQLHAGLGPAELEARRLMVESFGRPDFEEGVRSFLDKRPPKFRRLP
jgi:enoyl-CoA hydratase/carnithine racemase